MHEGESDDLILHLMLEILDVRSLTSGTWCQRLALCQANADLFIPAA